MDRKIWFAIAAILLIAMFSGCTAKYEPQAEASSTTKSYTIQDRGDGSYLVEPATITRNNVPQLLLGYDEINKKCDIIAVTDLSAFNGEGYSADSSVALLVKVSSCNGKVDAIPK